MWEIDGWKGKALDRTDVEKPWRFSGVPLTKYDFRVYTLNMVVRASLYKYCAHVLQYGGCEESQKKNTSWKVQETSATIDMGYATRIYRCPALLPSGWKTLFIYGRPPDDKRGGAIFPIQGGYWMVTLSGALRDYPPDDEAGLLAFARSLAQPDLYEAMKDAEPVTPIAVYKYSANKWRHYERTRSLPEGFIILGDAVCCFNPIYGQGMSVAALEAQALDRCLRVHSPLKCTQE